MKAILFLGIMCLLHVEEPSYNFGGHYLKDSTTKMTIDVRDGSYWVVLSSKRGADSATCELSEKAAVKQGTLRVHSTQDNQLVTLIISPADHTQKMVVRGLSKADRVGLMQFCKSGGALAGSYSRVPLP